MEINGKSKKKVDEAENIKVKKAINSNDSIELTYEELGDVAGGRRRLILEEARKCN